ncbi:hypothetical protein BZA70DRAFT_78437 [Myxozyma melibiosi]|uniref:Uncharacterized protein n=1 Tax=Myxozyma melibiosi TaxID=54550 RepID=A0ABR1F0J2_9ASCO
MASKHRSQDSWSSRARNSFDSRARPQLDALSDSVAKIRIESSPSRSSFVPDETYNYLIKISSLTFQTTPNLPSSTGTHNNKPNDYPFVPLIAEIYNLPESRVERDVYALLRTVTPAEYINDLKFLLECMRTATRPSASEFSSEKDFKTWCRFEISAINQIILGIVQGGLQILPSNSAKHSLVFIPENPSTIYFLVLKKCLSRDISSFLLKTKSEQHADVMDPLSRRAISILSEESRDLLNTLFLRWRVGKATRDVLTLRASLDLVIGRAMPMAAFLNMFRLISFEPLTTYTMAHEPWTISNQNLYRECLMAIYDLFLARLTKELDKISNLEPIDIAEILAMFDLYLFSDAYFALHGVPFSETITTMEKHIRGAVRRHFSESIASASEDGLWPALALINGVLENEILWLRQVCRDYSMPKMHGSVNLLRWSESLDISRVASSEFVLAASETSWEILKNSMLKGRSPEEETEQLEELSRFYYSACELRQIQKMLSEETDPSGIETELYPVILKSIRSGPSSLHLSTNFRQDSFLPIDDQASYSARVMEIDRIWRSRLSLVQSLNWPVEIQLAAFYDAVIRDFAAPVRAYLDYLRLSFSADLNVQDSDADFYSIPLEVRVKFSNLRFLNESLQETRDLLRDRFMTSVLEAETEEIGHLISPDYCLKFKILELENYIISAGCRAVHISIETKDADSGQTRTVQTRPLSTISAAAFVWNEEFELRFPRDTEVYMFTMRLVEHLADETLVEEESKFVDVDVRDSFFYEAWDYHLAMQPHGLEEDSAHGLVRLRMQLTKDSKNPSEMFDSLISEINNLETILIQGTSEQMFGTIYRVLSLDNLLDSSEAEDFDVKKEAISSLLNYLELSFATITAQVGKRLSQRMMLTVWDECIEALNILLDAVTDPDENLIEKEKTDVVNQWLQTLKKFFYSGGRDVPLAMLESAKLREILRRVY